MRLIQAAREAQDRQVIQFLAGAPELLARYRNAPPAAAAVIHAAMDARRLGTRRALPHAFLEAAAPGYLTGSDWDALPENWLEQAFLYTAAPCQGVRGPLTRIRPRLPYADDPDFCTGPTYLLADYLDQHGRSARRNQIPPAAFWDAVARHAHPGDMAVLGVAAFDRSLYRYAAQLYKHAIAHSKIPAASPLVELLHRLHPGDLRPASWCAEHVALSNPDAVSDLLHALMSVGARHQITALLARRPAAHVAVDDPEAVANLLDALELAGARDEVTVWLGRLTQTSSHAMADLLKRVQDTREPDQITALAGRIATHTALDSPRAVTRILRALRHVGEEDQVTALLARDPAAHVTLGNPYDVAHLLRALQEADANQQVAVLLHRNPAALAALDNPRAVAILLRMLREAGALDQVTALADRAAAHTALDDPGAVTFLLHELGNAGAEDQTAELLARDPAAQVILDDRYTVSELLRTLREAGAHDQVRKLANRAVTRLIDGPLDDPYVVSDMLHKLRAAGAGNRFIALTDRAALDDLIVHVLMQDVMGRNGTRHQLTDQAERAAVNDVYRLSDLLHTLQEAGAREQVLMLLTHRHAALDNPYEVAILLRTLNGTDARDQVAALAARTAAHVAVDDPVAVALLLKTLQEAGTEDQATALASRAAAHVALDDLGGVALLLKTLQEAGTEDQATALASRAAAHAVLEDPGVSLLLGTLRETGAQDQAALLVSRLPEAGMFQLIREEEGHHKRFRFGREADGSPAEPWGWENLD